MPVEGLSTFAMFCVISLDSYYLRSWMFQKYTTKALIAYFWTSIIYYSNLWSIELFSIHAREHCRVGNNLLTMEDRIVTVSSVSITVTFAGLQWGGFCFVSFWGLWVFFFLLFLLLLFSPNIPLSFLKTLIMQVGAKELSEWVRRLAALSEDPGSIISAYMEAHSRVWLQLQGLWYFLLASLFHRQ